MSFAIGYADGTQRKITPSSQVTFTVRELDADGQCVTASSYRAAGVLALLPEDHVDHFKGWLNQIASTAIPEETLAFVQQFSLGEFEDAAKTAIQLRALADAATLALNTYRLIRDAEDRLHATPTTEATR